MLPQLLRFNRPWIWLLLLFCLYNLAGFALVPWLAERQLASIATERLELDATTSRIRFNPWSWQVIVDDLDVTEADGQTLLSFRSLDANLEFWNSLRTRTVTFAWLDIEGLYGYLEQIDSERTNVGNLGQRWLESAAPEPAESTGTANAETEDDVGAGVVLRRLSIRDAALAIVDRVPPTDLEFAIRPINLQLDNVSTLPGESLQLQSAMQFSRGGSLQLSGALAWQPQLDARFEFQVDDLALDWLDNYLEPYVAIQIADGRLQLVGSLTATAANPADVKIDVEIDDLEAVHDGLSVAAWEQLAIPQVHFSLADRRLEIGAVALTRPVSALTIYAEGDTNLSRLQVGNSRTGVDPEAEPVPAQEGDDAPGDATSPLPAGQTPSPAEVPEFTYAIAGISVIDASLDFTDLALPLPFRADIREFNGEVSAIANTTREPATLSLEGRVGEFGAVTASGELLPLAWQDLTHIELAFRNVSLPETSPYLIKFAGRTIDSGKLDLDLGYRIEASGLQGDNHLVLREFKLGERVDHPDALNLPLDLAIALLKDRDGVIDIELPVTGELGDPQFSYGGVIRKALVNLITGIATAPFRFLANLVGGDQALDRVEFAGGRSDLAPPEREVLVKLAEALSRRPQLVLQVPAPYHSALDRPALQRSRFAARLEAAVGIAATEAPEAGSSAQRRSALETIYRERTLEPSLDLLAPEFTTTNAESGESTFDVIGYLAELERRLVASEPVTDSDLQALALARASAVSASLTSIDANLGDRIQMDSEATEIADTGATEITLELALASR